MPDGWYIGHVHRLVWLRLDGNAYVLVIVQENIERIKQLVRGASHILRLAHVGSLARQPQHQQARLQFMSDIDRFFRTVERIAARFRIVRCKRAIDRHRVFPQARGNKLGCQAILRELLASIARSLANLLSSQIIQPRHGIVIVKLHGIEI